MLTLGLSGYHFIPTEEVELPLLTLEFEHPCVIQSIVVSPQSILFAKNKTLLLLFFIGFTFLDFLESIMFLLFPHILVQGCIFVFCHFFPMPITTHDMIS